jgi:hypothetical protein
LNNTFQLNGGFTGTLFKKKVGGTFGINYTQNNRRLQFDNAIIGNNQGDHEVQYHNEKY